MATLTIFANFYINDKEGFLRMQDSFRSFKNINAKKWIINVRGKYKFDTLFFLHNNLGDILTPYTLESKNGWFYDTKQMLKDINTDYVFLWVEDHVNLVDTDKYKNILNEMKENGSEYLNYSFWCFGKPMKEYSVLKKYERDNIYTFLFDKEAHRKVSQYRPYIVSLLGIFSQEFFKKIINKEPGFLRQWSKFTPLDFEKRYHQTEWLPVKYAIPKYELFASIDDDLGCEGYSLQSRDIYPKRVLRGVGRKVKNPITPSKIFFRQHVRKYIPDIMYSKKIQAGTYVNRLRLYISLLIHGE